MGTPWGQLYLSKFMSELRKVVSPILDSLIAKTLFLDFKRRSTLFRILFNKHVFCQEFLRFEVGQYQSN